jgi:hypothetical protein
MFDAILDYVIDYARNHPVRTLILVLALLRMCGTVVQSGSTGVLFVWGRARKTLPPGFHFLVPLLHSVRKTPVRSITLELPKQRVTTVDGLVFEVDANVVYHIDDAILALTHIHDLKKGCAVVLAIAVQQVLGRHTRQSLRERQSLDEELAVQTQEKLTTWGVKVEQAGFMTIAPTRKTLRLTQLSQLVRERQRVLEEYRQEGLAPELAVALLGSHRQLTGHARARYRKLHRKPRVRRAPVVQTVAMLSTSDLDTTVAVHDALVHETGTRAIANRPVVLQVGETLRWRMSSRRKIDKVLLQMNASLRVQPIPNDPSSVAITALKEGETVLLVRNDRAIAETVRITVTSF